MAITLLRIPTGSVPLRCLCPKQSIPSASNTAGFVRLFLRNLGVRNNLLPLLAGIVLSLFLVACGEASPAEAEPENTAVTARESAAEIPLVTLHTATLGRLPLRRQANGKLRARREITIKSQTGGTVLTAPTEGTYYKDGELLLATDPRPLELARDRARAARDEAAFRQRDLLLRISANLPPGDRSVT